MIFDSPSLITVHCKFNFAHAYFQGEALQPFFAIYTKDNNHEQVFSGSALGSALSFPGWILATAKAFGGQRLATVQRIRISWGVRKLSRTPCGIIKNLDQKNTKDNIALSISFVKTETIQIHWTIVDF